MHTGFKWGNLGEGDHLEDRRVDGRMILKWVFEKCERGVNWIDVVQDRDTRRALVNAVMNFWVP